MRKCLFVENLSLILLILHLGSCDRNEKLDSTVTPPINKQTIPKPTNLYLVSLNTSSVYLHWDDVTIKTGYNIYIGEDSTSTSFFQFVTNNSNRIEFQFDSNKTYYFRSQTKYQNDSSELSEAVRLKFNFPIYVKGGTFQMGDSSGALDQRAIHNVTLSNFYISRYEVTVTQYREFCQSHFATCYPQQPLIGKDDFPMVNVSWSDAEEFCTWLTQKTGKKHRLPTESEWEFVARGGSKSGSYLYSGSNVLDSVGWNINNSGNMLHGVGLRLPNELGVYDLSGNVREWCSDWYGEYITNIQINPQGPSSGVYKVQRGGYFNDYESSCRVSARYRDAPNSKQFNVGFRYVQEE